VRLSDGSVRNDYLVKIRNMENRPRAVEIAITGLPGGIVWTEQGDRAHASQTIRLDLAADQVAQSRLFVASDAAGATRRTFALAVRALDREGGGDRVETVFERPE